MRILLLTQYYPPETGAPQNRLSGLAAELTSLGNEIVVLTAMPNYPAMKVYHAYRGKLFLHEKVDGINVFRSWIYASKNRSVFSRLLNYFSFTFSSILASFKVPGKFDLVLCESPPLFLGLSGLIIKKIKQAVFVLNVSDLWPESAEKLGVIRNKFLLNLAKYLEEFLYKKSKFVTGQTKGIVRDINDRFPNKTVHWLPNGVDHSIFSFPVNRSWRNLQGFLQDDYLLLYAGVIGIAQGLDVILDAAKLLPSDSKVKFVLLGDGPEKEKLIKRKEMEKIDCVFFPDAVLRDEIPNVLHSIDAAIIPLKKMDLFLGAIPSKIFECLALKKPILLAVDGEARQLFINQGHCGIYIEPENPGELMKAAQWLSVHTDEGIQMGENGFRFVNDNFMRNNIAKRLDEVIRDNL